MVAFLEKTNGNVEFHEIIDFLTRSSIHYALTVSLVVSTTFVEQFWMTVKSKTINNVRYITATVAGKPVSISEASIRSDLQFNDAAGIDGKKISGNVTPLFPSMLAQPTEDEGAVSERPSETQPTPSLTYPSEDQSKPQPDPFLRPSSSNPIPDSILEGSGGNHGECLHEEKIGKEEVFEDKVDAEGVYGGRISSKTLELSLSGDIVVLEEKESTEKGVSTEVPNSTDKPKVSTDKVKVSTNKLNKGTAEPKDGNSDESDAPTTVFGDDETIAQVLITMSHNKVKQKEKEKGIELKEIKDTDRPRTTTERLILTLKPLLKIDPKDKGKKVLEEKLKQLRC
ncbi:hypothetical protein Tco_1400539 [Tanacetum coccineum]